MRIGKILIFILFLLDWSGGVEARNAFRDFPRHLTGCANTSRDIPPGGMVVRYSLDPADLYRRGWFSEDGTPLFGGASYGTLTVGQAGPTLSGNVHTLIYRSINLNTGEEYEDVLTITVFPRPQVWAGHMSVCPDEEITLSVDSARNHTGPITWIDQTTHVEYNEGQELTITESRRFSVLATNEGCYGANAGQTFVNVSMTPRIDTMQMRLRESVWVELCPGCTRRLSDLLILEHADSLYISSSTWTLNGANIPALNLNSPIGSPPAPRLQDVYLGWINGRLYTSNECGYTTRTLINAHVRLEINREGCRFRTQWLSTWPPLSRTLTGHACTYHIIEIFNPRPNTLTIQNAQADIQFVSNNNFPVTFQSASVFGTYRVYRFAYRPEKNDTLRITVNYRNICCGGATTPFVSTLYFRTNESIFLDPNYCRTDSLHLEFSSNRGAHFTIDSISIHNESYADSFHLSQRAQNFIVYTFKDTVHSWRDRFSSEFQVFVRYTYCGVTRDTIIKIVPELASDCLPRVVIIAEECLGDTNFIIISERRRPYSYIVSIDFDVPPTVQFIGELDTVFDALPVMQFRQRFIAYDRLDQIGFEILYRETHLDTLVEGTLIPRIRPNCTPMLGPIGSLFCRGQETEMEIRLRNRNGRLISVDWGVSEGRSHFYRDTIDEDPIHLPPEWQIQRVYHYTARFQKTTNLDIVVTYSYGDSIGTHRITPIRHIIIRDDCQAYIYQPTSNKTYCDGEVARFEIRPYPTSENEIVRVVWNYVPFSPMRFDFTDEATGYWHFYTNVYRDTTFVAFVQEVDFWGDIVYYTLSDYIFVQPFPRIWRQRVIDVCRSEVINLNAVENGIQKYWNPEFITRVNFAMPPFNNASANAWLSPGETMRPFVVQAEARYHCASMGAANLVYDTIYLRWNEPPAVSMMPFPEDVCQNDTLRLRVTGVDVFSTVTWLRGDDIIFTNRNVSDSLWDIVTIATYYTVINTTACGETSDRRFLNVTPAPTLNLTNLSRCLHDFVTLSLPPDPNIVAHLPPQWHVGDEIFVGHTFDLQINDADNPTVVTVLARGYNDCNAKGTIEITPIPLPNVNVSKGGIPGDTVSCVGIAESFSLYVTGDPDLNWAWVYPTPIGLPSTSLVKNVPPTNEAATFRIQGFDPYTGCYNFANFHIIILENDINFTLDMYGNFVADDRACIHANFVFEAEYVPYMLHTWRTLYGRDIHSRFLTIYNVVPADIGSYRLVRNLHTCRDTSWLDIDLIPFPNLAFDGLLPSYCVGYTVEFRVVPGVGVYYFWRDPFGVEQAAHHYKLTDISLAYSGDFLLRTMYNNCWHYDTLRVIVYPLPIIDFTPYYFLCDGDVLTMNMYRSNATYVWCTGETTPTIQVTEGGYYTVTIVENNCVSTATVYIEERPKPRFHLPRDTSTCWEGEGFRIETIGLNPTFFNDVEFSWTKNAQLLSQMESIDAIAAGTYTLLTELHGCHWLDSIRITNIFCDAFIMPSAFRPGSAIEINRTFGPSRTFPDDLVVFEMFIYDQWGNRKFRTDNQNIRWDGRDMNGRELRSGIYIWVIIAHETLSGQNLSTHGTVALIK